ncbi:MAG: glycoside hydrolase family 3 N-terminal domain-containing protein, partial [Kiritimatiellia bacterium]|nr:glycoside hydrolase family 3 N-terminal domain-containing protein [Kiritimatiellia bacterium]
GVDDRDQHLCTSVNSLSVDSWFESFGRVWRAAIDAGVMSIMAGHISFPAWQGLAGDPDAALPATLCEKLQIGLLREKLGFEGVLVSDAAPMIGLTSRAPADELAWRNIAAGSDVFLFADPIRDFKRLIAAVKAGLLSESRVTESARRVLEMKARLNLHQDAHPLELSEAQFVDHAATAQEMADRGITRIREHPGCLPLPPRSRILTVTLTVKDHGRPIKDLDVVDLELRKRGFEVEHQLNPGHDFLLANVDRFDRILINFYMLQHMEIGRITLGGPAIMAFWRAFYANALDKTVFTSFGNPYVLYEQPHINNLLLAYGPAPVSQRAAVKVWCGELEPRGGCPVRLPRVHIGQ